MARSILCLLLFFISSLWLSAQTPVQITILSDSEDPTSAITEGQVREELETLISGRFTSTIQSVALSPNENYNSTLSDIYQGNSDLVIGIGFEACNLLASQATYPKPTIAAFMLDNELQGVKAPVDGTSDITNFNYIQSPFDIGRDFEMLYEIKPYRRLAIVVNSLVRRSDFDFVSYLNKMVAFSGASYDVFALEDSAEGLLNGMASDIDAAIVFPLFDPEKLSEIEKVFTGMAERGIPTFSVFSNPAIDLGAYAAFDTESNFARIPRPCSN